MGFGYNPSVEIVETLLKIIKSSLYPVTMGSSAGSASSATMSIESAREMNSVAHRRQYPRYTAVFTTKYTVKEGTFRDLIKDVGAGGVFISTRKKIVQGRSINIQFPVFAFGKRLSIIGTIVRCESNGFAVMFNEAIDVKLFEDGGFPGNVAEGTRPTIDAL